jgi:hypothetical protein
MDAQAQSQALREQFAVKVQRSTLQINILTPRFGPLYDRSSRINNSESVRLSNPYDTAKPYLPNVDKFDGVLYYFDTWLPSIEAKLLIDGEALGDLTRSILLRLSTPPLLTDMPYIALKTTSYRTTGACLRCYNHWLSNCPVPVRPNSRSNTRSAGTQGRKVTITGRQWFLLWFRRLSGVLCWLVSSGRQWFLLWFRRLSRVLCWLVSSGRQWFLLWFRRLYRALLISCFGFWLVSSGRAFLRGGVMWRSWSSDQLCPD